MARQLLVALIVLAAASASFGAEPPSKSSAGFYHPGVLVNRAQLELIKAKVAAGDEPWKSAYEAAKASEYGSLSYTPRPRATIECGPYSKPDLGCKDEQRDSVAAYTHALLWSITGESKHADKAIEIMNAWSSRLTGGDKKHHAPLRA